VSFQIKPLVYNMTVIILNRRYGGKCNNNRVSRSVAQTWCNNDLAEFGIVFSSCYRLGKSTDNANRWLTRYWVQESIYQTSPITVLRLRRRVLQVALQRELMYQHRYYWYRAKTAAGCQPMVHRREMLDLSNLISGATTNDTASPQYRLYNSGRRPFLQLRLRV